MLCLNVVQLGKLNWENVCRVCTNCTNDPELWQWGFSYAGPVKISSLKKKKKREKKNPEPSDNFHKCEVYTFLDSQMT